MKITPIPVDFQNQLDDIQDINKGELLEALDTEASTSIRLNPFKTKSEFEGESIPWSKNGFILNERPRFTLDPLFHGGAYYVQESSSQFLEYLLSPYKDEITTVLDACAAPGGKTTHLMTMFPEGVVFSNEINRKRYQILKENIIKSGVSNAFVLNKSTEQIGQMKSQFDLVVVDAPCSGEGMFRKDMKAREEWSLGNVDICVERQESILNNLIPVVKPGGFMLYSTCTFNRRENDGMVEYLLENGFELLSIDKVPENISKRNLEGGSVYSFYPGRTPGEGFFCALLKKVEGEKRALKKSRLKAKSLPAFAPSFKETMALVDSGKLEFLWPKKSVEVLKKIDFDLVSDASLILGELKGKNLIPDHSIALSRYCQEESIELNEEDALEFLRRNNVLVKSGSKGMNIVSFKGVNLGWVKVISPTRVNNYYPKDWRIRNL